MTTKMVKGTCRQGNGAKVHAAVMEMVETESGSMEALRCGAWKQTGMYCVCEGQRSRGGHAYWGFVATGDFSSVTCKDCKAYRA